MLASTAHPLLSVVPDTPPALTWMPPVPVPSARVSRTVSAPLLAVRAAAPGVTMPSATTGLIEPMLGQVTTERVLRYSALPPVDEQVMTPVASWYQSAVDVIVYVIPPIVLVAGAG
jgi:hypothetical protein